MKEAHEEVPKQIVRGRSRGKKQVSYDENEDDHNEACQTDEDDQVQENEFIRQQLLKK